MKKEYLYLSSICTDYQKLAHKYALGIEIAQYCTAYNMDEKFDETDKEVKEAMKNTNRFKTKTPCVANGDKCYDCAILDLIESLRSYRHSCLPDKYGISRFVSCQCQADFFIFFPRKGGTR